MLSRSRSSRTTDLTVPYCLPPPLPTCLLPPTRPQAFRTTDLNFPDQTTRQSALGHDQPPRAQRQTKPGRRLPVQTGRHVFPTPSVPHDAPCWPYPFLSTRLLSPHPYSPNDWPVLLGPPRTERHAEPCLPHSARATIPPIVSRADPNDIPPRPQPCCPSFPFDGPGHDGPRPIPPALLTSRTASLRGIPGPPTALHLP